MTGDLATAIASFAVAAGVIRLGGVKLAEHAAASVPNLVQVMLLISLPVLVLAAVRRGARLRWPSARSSACRPEIRGAFSAAVTPS